MCADSVISLFFILFRYFASACIPLSIGFLVTIILLFSLRFLNRFAVDKKREITFWNALLIGIFQGLALQPGVSRFGVVFVLMRWLGYSGQIAFDTAWLLQIPVMASAILYTFYIVPFADITALVTMPGVGYSVVSSTLCALVFFFCAAYLAKKNRLWWCAFYVVIPFIFSVCIQFAFAWQ